LRVDPKFCLGSTQNPSERCEVNS